MFDGGQVLQLANKYGQTLRALASVQTQLEAEFDSLNDAILALILSVASGEPLLLIGPPGTAKSTVIRRFCRLVGIETDAEGRGYFEYLLTPFTEPGELWGFYNPAKLKDGILERTGKNLMMQYARVVFLDEVFKGSSAILNSLLSFMNDRVFYDRGQRTPVKLQCLFAATNELPETTELQAVADRFALRCRVENAAADKSHLDALIRKAWPLTYGPERAHTPYPALLDELHRLRDDIRSRASLFKPDERVPPVLAQLVTIARGPDASRFSNRRLIKFLWVMLIHRIYAAAHAGRAGAEQFNPVRSAEAQLLPKYFLVDDTDDAAIHQMHDCALALG